MSIYVFLIFTILKVSHCLERELTVNIDPFKEDCFFQTANQGDVIDVEYQVIDGGHGDLDITFHLIDPHGRVLIADIKKTENSHRVDAQITGDYKLCFDNTFSSYNVKTVFFELIVEGEDNNEWDIDTSLLGNVPEEVYEVQVKDIQNVINNVKNDLTKIRQIQEILKSVEARDRNVAEENFFKVNTFSLVQIFVMAFVGFVQVIMLRSLFDENSRVHKIWQNFDSKRNQRF